MDSTTVSMMVFKEMEFDCLHSKWDLCDYYCKN